MNISSINSYNYTFFTAQKSNGKYAANGAKRAVRPSQNNSVKHSDVSRNASKNASHPARRNSKKQQANTRMAAYGLAGLVTIGAGGLLVTSCNPDSNKPVSTQPTAYVETTPIEETIPETTAPQKRVPVVPQPTITTRPLSERTPKYHVVKAGDRLADIVKNYAEIDANTPDENLVPYYVLLEADNPGAWKDRNIIYKDLKIRVDSILPENIIIEYPEEEDYFGTSEETQPTEVILITPEQDTISINGIEFQFDKGTASKTLFGEYRGQIGRKYATLDKKNGGFELTKYEGSDSKSNISQKVTYDKDGKIVELVDYSENKQKTQSTYTYRANDTIEKINDKTANKNQIGTVITSYDNKIDSVNNREFLVNGYSIAKFDFTSGAARIGNNTWNFDMGSFVCNDDVIGSQKYVGDIQGQKVRFDVLKNGFCVEYLNSQGEIITRDQFDVNGNLIYSENN